MIVLKAQAGNIAIMELAPGADKAEALRKFRELHPEFIEDYEGEFELPGSSANRDRWTLKEGKIIEL